MANAAKHAVLNFFPNFFIFFLPSFCRKRNKNFIRLELFMPRCTCLCSRFCAGA